MSDFLVKLVTRDQSIIQDARAFLNGLSPLHHKFECSFEISEDFGGRGAAFIDFYPVDNDLAKDHKKFGGLFIRVWLFGEPAMFTLGLFLGAERAEQSEPRRGVSFTREKLGSLLTQFEKENEFDYHTWSSGNFPWATKSSRAVARQLEQYISFRQDPAEANNFAHVASKIAAAIKFLDKGIIRLKPIIEFGRDIIREYYSENLPTPIVSSQLSTGMLSEILSELDSTLAKYDVGLITNKDLLQRYIASLLSKRFIVLTGLAGSGKTKIAQAFARWITPDPGWIDADHSKGKNPNPYYALVPVGADWTGNENIIGYPNGLDTATYITKPALELVRHALEPAHAAIPHFLILDEMNLSHVERYFADILSAIESGEEIPLYEGDERMVDGGAVPRKLRLPENLFIIGTVNVDETTYMFSPKVLDRANVIEFRLEPDGLQAFLSSPKAPRLEELDGKGAGFGRGFVEAAADKGREVPAAVKADYEREMLLFFNLLREHNAEFGYRTSYEAARFIHFYNHLGGYPDGSSDWFDRAMDAVVVQKLLPKLHGSRSKLEGLLWALAWACGAERIERDGKSFAAQIREASQAQADAQYGPETLWDKLSKSNPDDPAAAARYPLSFDKVMRMWRKLVRDQFVTFAEA